MLVGRWVRNLLRLIDGLPTLNILGIILIISSAEGQRFGDRIAKTFVTESTKHQDSPLCLTLIKRTPAYYFLPTTPSSPFRMQ